jgi:peptidoglycan-N-acetylglucosamine deacetylase
VMKTPSFIAREIEDTDRVIREAGYRDEIQFRAPFNKKLIGLPWYLARHNRNEITWDIDPMSDRRVDHDTDRIVAFVLARARPGSIILLHPMYKGREATRAAIAPIIDELRSRGYQFVTINELLALRPHR